MKTMKKVSLLLLAVLLCVSFGACKSKYTPGDRIKAFTDELQPNGGDFYYKAEVTVDSTMMTIEMALKGDMFFINMSQAGEQALKFICNGEGTYLVDDKSKQAIRYSDDMDIDEIYDVSTLDIAAAIEEDSSVKVTAGSEEYQGVKYNYERITDGNGNYSTYYFDTKTNKLVYEVAATSVVKFIDYHYDAADSLFVVPSDYTIL